MQHQVCTALVRLCHTTTLPHCLQVGALQLLAALCSTDSGQLMVVAQKPELLAMVRGLALDGDEEVCGVYMHPCLCG